MIVITPGDPKGVGPEILIKIHRKLLTLQKRNSAIRFLFIGDRRPFLGCTWIQETDIASLYNQNREDDEASHSKILFLACPSVKPSFTNRGSNRLFSEDGYACGWSIETAVKLIHSGIAKNIATGPISKEKLNLGGYLFPGHTEMLESRSRTLWKQPIHVTMVLANEKLRVALVTNHVSIKNVSRSVTKARIKTTVQNMIAAFSQKNKSKLRIAVLGLNPHCGESSLFGTEEAKTINPVLKYLQKHFREKADFFGPFPADTFFARYYSDPVTNAKSWKMPFDAVVAMYHDQGLIPVKMVDFHRTINMTLGLPFLRTSVDHGTAFDIAGKGIVDTGSFEAAINACVRDLH